MWWRKEPIMKLLTNQEMVSRRQLILAAANYDGGAHVDPKKPSDYAWLENGMKIEVDVSFSSGERKRVALRYANLAALRQIGHEILTSSELIALAE
jgi:hypothetical protein